MEYNYFCNNYFNSTYSLPSISKIKKWQKQLIKNFYFTY